MALSETMMERRRRESIDEIAHAALQLFRRDGFDATSVEAIANAAGCSPRTFYRYFGDKEDVMFHDLPDYLDGLRVHLDGHLGAGMGEWEAVCKSVLEFIAQFDAAADGRFPIERMKLWVSEPALRSRYLLYVHQAEQVISESIRGHRGPKAERDDRTELMAAAAIAATRVTLLTHSPTKRRGFADHLSDALAALTMGLGVPGATAG
jgi:AcrR family transcriptional regulator